MRDFAILKYIIYHTTLQVANKISKHPDISFIHEITNNKIGYEYESNGCIFQYILLKKHEIQRINKILNESHIHYRFDDLTSFYHMGINVFPTEFKKQIDNYILENFKMDDILDKIIDYGIESLNKIDKKILERV